MTTTHTLTTHGEAQWAAAIQMLFGNPIATVAKALNKQICKSMENQSSLAH